MELIDDLLTRLRDAGGDTTDIEVKTSAGGLSPSLNSTLSALANRPGGGWIILGLDENENFSAVNLDDPNALKQGLVGKARACHPPVGLTFHDAQVDGKVVVLTEVAECAPSAKPCRDGASGQAWLRSWDGDFVMSAIEEQAFLRQREQPLFDQQPVIGATVSDLDEKLVSTWQNTVAERDEHGLGRFHPEERLFRGGVITDTGTPTLAGLLALGVHPQQFFPRFVVNVAALDDASSGTRAREPQTFSGPIPKILDASMQWARRNFGTAVIADETGSVRDARDYPLEAFRELIANALVHRDLDSWSRGKAIEVRLRPDRLVVSNPGGLYGITVDRLGREGTTSARNALLIEICRYTRTTDGDRVVETLASGIPRVLDTLKREKHPAPLFQDNGASFTVVLRRRSDTPPPPPHSAVPGVGGTGNLPQAPTQRAFNDTEAAILKQLAVGPKDVKELELLTGRKGPTLRRNLRTLRDEGRVQQLGGRGRPTTYTLTASLRA